MRALSRGTGAELLVVGLWESNEGLRAVESVVFGGLDQRGN